MSQLRVDGEEEVVLRNPHRKSDQLNVKVVEELKEGEKRVKWSESTELREKMKEYRRSQLSMSLDYHHIAIEEERERAGVKEWRASLQMKTQEEEDEEEEERAIQREKENIEKEEENSDVSSSESDEFQPGVDEDLERRLRVIKAATTKHTLLPAYRAALDVYKPWLADKAASLTDKDATKYQKQCDLYTQVVSLYDEWSSDDSPEKVDSRFDKITELLQQAKGLGDPPSCVAEAIGKVLTSAENVKKQNELYEQMVNDMVEAYETTTL